MRIFSHLPNPLTDDRPFADTEPCPSSDLLHLPQQKPLDDAWSEALAIVLEEERADISEQYLRRTCGAELERARQAGADLDTYRLLCDALDAAVPHMHGDPLGALGELLRVVGGHCAAAPDAITVRV